MVLIAFVKNETNKSNTKMVTSLTRSSLSDEFPMLS